MLNGFEVLETNTMIERDLLDVRTITMGISLLGCIDSDKKKLEQNIYDCILRRAGKLVETGEAISREYGIPIVNKRVSVTPIALIGGSACRSKEDFAEIAETLDRAAKEIGVNFIGGYSALVAKGMTEAERLHPRSTRADGAGMQLCKCGFHPHRSQYGRRAPHGTGGQGNGGSNRGKRLSRLCEAGHFLQCAG